MRKIVILSAVCALSACSAAQQANVHKNVMQFNSDLGQFNAAAAPVVKDIACIDATGAQISGPLLVASGNAAGVVVGAAGAAASQAVCPQGATAAVVAK